MARAGMFEPNTSLEAHKCIRVCVRSLLVYEFSFVHTSKSHVSTGCRFMLDAQQFVFAQGPGVEARSRQQLLGVPQVITEGLVCPTRADLESQPVPDKRGPHAQGACRRQVCRGRSSGTTRSGGGASAERRDSWCSRCGARRRGSRGGAAVGAGEPYTRCGSYQGQRGCEGRECQSDLYFLSLWLRCRAWPAWARLEAGEPEGRAEAAHVTVNTLLRVDHSVIR